MANEKFEMVNGKSNVCSSIGGSCAGQARMPVLLVVRVEHVLVYFARLASETGRAVAAGNLVTRVLHFRITSESSGLSNRSRRGKSEHYRAASPLTAGRPKISDFFRDLRFRATTSATEKKPAQLEISDLRFEISRLGDG